MTSSRPISVAVMMVALAVVSLQQADASTCKTLSGEMVGFGEQSTRAEAEDVLGREIVAWEAKYGLKAKPKYQKTICKDYIKFLNEFECKAEAVVCR